MYCYNCGNEISPTAIICPKCGVNVQPFNPYNSQKNGMAVAGFVCSFFIPLLGWIFGGIGLSRSSKRNGKGKGLSIAAIVIASAMFLINLATLK